MNKPQQETLFGHPVGLYTLFFAEMWERFSYYGMRALLVFYMIKGFLLYPDGDAYKVYGAYCSLVYMTPFFGGMLADRLMGARRCVILGGLLMAAGHLTMTVQSEGIFYLALALLVVGNGFFKPNISTIVGTLYGENDKRRDGGFTIFYMGINLGAAMAPLLCGYVGEVYGYHNGFGLATMGMLVGLAVFVFPRGISRFLVLAGAGTTAVYMIFLQAIQGNALLLLVNGFVAVALAIAGVIAFVAIGRGGIPDDVGNPPDPKSLNKPVAGIVPKSWLIYMGTLVSLPILVGLIWSNRMVTLIPEAWLEGIKESGTFGKISGTFLGEISTPTGLILLITGLGACLFLFLDALKSKKVERERMFVVLILMFFSLLFWAFFEQAGSSLNNFADRNVDRVVGGQTITQADVGKTMKLEMFQEQLGYANGDTMINLSVLQAAREEGTTEVDWKIDESHVGMVIGDSEVPASTFQSANPIYILIFGLAFTMLWGLLAKLNSEPSTPVKFALGLLQLGLGFVALWYGSQHCDERGMVGMQWLLLCYLLHTTGELCLSPVGLSMVTRLSPARLVSTVMGAWFLATAISNYLAAVIATFTGIEESGEGPQIVPVPNETVHVFGDVYGKVAIAAIVSSLICFILVPVLKKWMHEGEEVK